MDGIEIKQEIKEEIQDDYYHTRENEEDFNESMLLEVIKYEDDDEDFDKYEEQRYQDERSSHFKVYCAENPEKVFVNGEPEIYIPTVQPTNYKESNSDPLYITPEPTITTTSASIAPVIHNTQLPTAKREEFKKFRVVRAVKDMKSDLNLKVKVPPVKDLVQKTYSKKHKELQHPCTICRRIFSSVRLLREHERSCFKCKQCNLIVASMSHLVNHMKKCRRKRKDVLANASSKQHPRNSHVPDRSCNICSSTFQSVFELEEHQRRNHLTPNAYACHICDKKFDSESQAHIHISSSH
ncbi:zinc finger protein 60-like [Sitodiplosis mosellana]|uniref:zinc finger protein 60-like n=1 Tax=Sitodiplosis mosellana TaxID=263140 RepID=UPI0024441D0A|nr:zinc finger protein 60-like [Sitodiplosis mosellana]